jgi:hypothetical protein
VLCNCAGLRVGGQGRERLTHKRRLAHLARPCDDLQEPARLTQALYEWCQSGSLNLDRHRVSLNLLRYFTQ